MPIVARLFAPDRSLAAFACAPHASTQRSKEHFLVPAVLALAGRPCSRDLVKLPSSSSLLLCPISILLALAGRLCWKLRCYCHSSCRERKCRPRPAAVRDRCRVHALLSRSISSLPPPAPPTPATPEAPKVAAVSATTSTPSRAEANPVHSDSFEPPGPRPALRLQPPAAC